MMPSLVTLIGCAILFGCNTVGPAAVHNGRTAYNEAISATNHQQIFDVIVNFRYQEPSNLLAVSAVNASFRVAGNVGVNVGVGPVSSFARIAELLGNFHRAELLTLAHNERGEFVFVPSAELELGGEETRELIALLGLSLLAKGSNQLQISTLLGAGAADRLEMRVETRSLSDLIKIASAAMAVPRDQVRSGLATDTPALGLVGSEIRILSSQQEPSDALVAT